MEATETAKQVRTRGMTDKKYHQKSANYLGLQQKKRKLTYRKYKNSPLGLETQTTVEITPS
jgi:hypothetical protein